MKTKELELEEVVNENGKAEDVKPTQDIILTDKQQILLKQILFEKSQMQKQIEELSSREVMLSTLIMDSAGIDDSQIESAQLNDEATILTVTKKE